MVNQISNLFKIKFLKKKIKRIVFNIYFNYEYISYFELLFKQ